MRRRDDDDDDRPWFEPRESGWGWRPATWQAWALIVGIFVAALLLPFLFGAPPHYRPPGLAGPDYHGPR